MKYNLHQIPHSEQLPVGFHHSLVTVNHNSETCTKVYAIGTEDQGLEVYHLDEKLEAWNAVPCLYENETTRRLVAAAKCEHVLTGVGSSVYVLGGSNSSEMILKLDTVEQRWYSQDSPVEISSPTVAAVALGAKIVVLSGSLNNTELTTDVYVLDTVNSQWTSPQVSGVPPPLKDVISAVALGQETVAVQGSSENDVWFLKMVGGQFEEAVWRKTKVNTVPIVICGPSGVGKGTMINKLMKEFPEKFGFSVSHTTRKPREKEVDGVHYHFASRASMEEAIADGKFLEHANVHGNLYGTSIAAVEDVARAGKRCILDIDVQGAKSVKASSMQAVFIFITPPSFEELERRLRGRGTETNEQVIKRLQTAKRELELASDKQLFDHVVVNDDLEKTYQQMKAILGLLDNTHRTA